ANRALSPKQRVRERRYVAHVDAAADERAAFAQRFERGRYQRPDRGENDCGIEQFRGRLIAAARPSCAQRQSELLCSNIAGAREGVHLLSLRARDLRNDVRRCAEPIDPETPRVLREAPGAITDQSRAEQGGGVRVVEGVRQLEAIAHVRERVLGVAAVELVAREEGAVA